MEEAVPQDTLIGQTLGGLYRVERLIGKGGMGRVYEATHAHLGNTYAVKVLSAQRANKPDAVERFLREAKSATRIDHEHIVKVLNFDTHDDHGVFLVMELLEGESLAARLKRGPLPIEAAVDIATQTGDALQAAHDEGIVHRDLKPENIFLTQKNGRDFVKVLDFGISKIKTPEHGDINLTKTDQLLGTPLYISPELARGVSAIDHRADVYALGVIMYEMITGTPPFSGSNQFQLLYQHGNEAPDPPSQRAEQAKVPPHIEAAVLKALEKNPADRFENMSAFCDALQTPTVRKHSRRAGFALLAGAVVLFGGIGFAGWRARNDDVSPLPTVIEPKQAAPTPASSTPEPGIDVAATAQEEAPAPQVRLLVKSAPPGATVAVDGKKRGKTPLILEFPRGAAARLRFSLEGHFPKEQRVVADEDVTVKVRLRRRRPPPELPIKKDF